MRSPKTLRDGSGFVRLLTRFDRGEHRDGAVYPSTDYNPYLGLAGSGPLRQNASCRGVLPLSTMKRPHLRALVVLSAALTCAGCDVEVNRMERAANIGAAVEQRQADEFLAATKDTDALREELCGQYRLILTTCFPSYNGIVVKAVPRASRGVYSLTATHPFFSAYTFAAGDAGRLVRGFVAVERERLQRARVQRLEIMGDDFSPGFCYVQ